MWRSTTRSRTRRCAPCCTAPACVFRPPPTSIIPGHYAHKPELLGLAPLEALASGTPTLVSDAACLPELAVLPGCRVFHDEAELAAMLREQAAGRPEAPDAADMHAAVDRHYGPAVVGAGLLAMMGLGAPCAS